MNSTERKTDTAANSNEAARAEHTPGPWFYGVAYSPEAGEKPLGYRGPGYYDNAGIMGGPNSETIVGCDEYDIFGPFNESERVANIRLILAAPDLLEALEQLVEQLADGDFDGMPFYYYIGKEGFDRAIAAIKKARDA